MAIDRIMAEVERAVGEPGNVDRVEGPLAALARARDPVEPPGLLQPEAVAILDRPSVKRLVLFRRAIGFGSGAKTVDGIEHAGISLICRPDSSR